MGRRRLNVKFKGGEYMFKEQLNKLEFEIVTIDNEILLVEDKLKGYKKQLSLIKSAYKRMEELQEKLNEEQRADISF